MLGRLRALLRPAEGGTASHHIEKLISGVGALAAIYLVGTINALVTPDLGTPLIIASMGASAVLLFAAPHSPLTQPWPLLGGQLLCATIGVACVQQFGATLAGAALAVGLAVFVMYHLRCLHPPGGATALAAVVGGPSVHDLGYTYIVAPVMLDTCSLLVAGIVLNFAFSWRRYPAVLAQPKDKVAGSEQPEALQSPLTAEDIRFAVGQMESFVDVSEQDLQEIYRLAMDHADSVRMKPEQIMLGRYYSNGRTGVEWAVRRVIDEAGVTTPAKDRVIYRVSAGRGANTTGTCTRAEFAVWSKYEVALVDGVWTRVS